MAPGSCRLTKRVVQGLAGAATLAAGTQAYASAIAVAAPADLPNAMAPGNAVGPAWDVDGDGVTDFQFNFRFPNTVSPDTGLVWQANSVNLLTNAVVGYQGPFVAYATKLAAGASIGPASPFESGISAGQVVLGSRYMVSGVANTYGGFGLSPGTGFLGLRFQISGTTHFGWLELEVKPPPSASATSGGIYFHSAGYESSANTAIKAGEGLPTQTPDPPTPVPEPASLTLLALGAAGMKLARRRTK